MYVTVPVAGPVDDIYDTGLSAPGNDIYGAAGSFVCVLGAPGPDYPGPDYPGTIDGTALRPHLPHSGVSQQIAIPLAHQPSVPVPFVPPQMIPHSFDPSVPQFNTPPPANLNFSAPAKSQTVISQLQSNTLPSRSSSNQMKSSQNLPESHPKSSNFAARKSQTAIPRPSGSHSSHFSPPPENLNASRSSQHFPEPSAPQLAIPKPYI